MRITRKRMIGLVRAYTRQCTKAFLLCLLCLASNALAASEAIADGVRVTVLPRRKTVTTPDQPPFFLLRFTPHSVSDNRGRMNLFLKPLQVARGVGLVVENSEGRLDLSPEPQTDIWDELERIELFVMPPSGGELQWGSSFEIEACLGFRRKLREPDIYYVSYSHPPSWLGPEDGGRKIGVGSSNTLVLAVVTPERLEELRQLREGNAEIAAASYQFRHFSRAHPVPAWLRFDPYRKLHEMRAIKVGAQRDEVLFLLGPPDDAYRRKKRQDESNDELWTYALSNVGGLSIYFLNGEVVEVAHGFDHPELMVGVGGSRDYVRFVLGAPDELRQWKKPQPGGYDELWSYGWGVRVWLLDGRIVRTENRFENPELFSEEEPEQGRNAESQETAKDR